MWRLRSPGRKLLFENVLTQQVQPSTPWALAVMPYLAFNFYPTVMVEKNGDAFCDHTAFAGYLVALGHGLKMTQTILTVYRENGFSVDLRENPMFMRVKQGSLFCERSELQEELGLRSDVNRACRQAPIDDCLAFGLGQPELGLGMQHLDLNGRVGSVAVGHGQAV